MTWKPNPAHKLCTGPFPCDECIRLTSSADKLYHALDEVMATFAKGREPTRALKAKALAALSLVDGREFKAYKKEKEIQHVQRRSHK